MMTQAWLKDHFDYHEDGWLVVKRRWGRNAPFIGKRIGWRSCQYLQVRIFGIPYYLHKLIWMWHHGYWSDESDHIDRNSFNNRIENLRDVTHSENVHNTGIWKSNVTGVKGVCATFGGPPYRAILKVNGKVFKSQHSTFEEAVIARKQFEEKYASNQ